MSIKSDNAGTKATSPFAEPGKIKPAWLALLRQFPDRFVIGSDQFFDQSPTRLERARSLVDALPPDLARAVAGDNAKRIYRLPTPP